MLLDFQFSWYFSSYKQKKTEYFFFSFDCHRLISEQIDLKNGKSRIFTIKNIHAKFERNRSSSFRVIKRQKALGSGRVGPGHVGNRFRGWKQSFFLLWTIFQKCFVSELWLVFFPTIVHSVTPTGSSLASSLRFTSFAITSYHQDMKSHYKLNKLYRIRIHHAGG